MKRGLGAGAKTEGCLGGACICVLRTPPRRIAYLRVMRPYEADAVVIATNRLVAWAKRHNVEGVPGDEISVIDFPAMRIAEVDIAGSLDLNCAP